MSETPRTDAYVLSGSQRSRQDMINFAKKLERELAERDAEIERLRAEVVAARVALSGTPT